MGFWPAYMGIYGGGSATVVQPVDGWIAQTRKRNWIAATRLRLWIAGSR